MSRIFRIAEMFHQQDSSCDEGPDALTAAVAADTLVIPTDHMYIAKTSGDDAEALTLADGKPGQILIINLVVAGGGAATLTPATSTGWSTIIFLGQYDQAVLLYIDDTVGWIIFGVSGTDQPPVVS